MGEEECGVVLADGAAVVAGGGGGGVVVGALRL